MNRDLSGYFDSAPDANLAADVANSDFDWQGKYPADFLALPHATKLPVWQHRSWVTIFPTMASRYCSAIG